MKFENVVIIEGHEETIKVCEKNLFCGPMRIGDIEIFERKLLVSRTPYVLAQIETIIQRESIEGRAMMYKKGYCIFVNEQDLQSGVNMKKSYVSDYGEEYALRLDKDLKA